MKVAFFSPLPPAKSGIADYSAALLEHLPRWANVETFAAAPADSNGRRFDPSTFDIAVYQLGNNPFHTFAYEAALKHPGVVVLHEANLHHLIADLTIRRNDWDAYLREVEINGGAEALEYALHYVRTLERGPDYELPMLRTILKRSRGVIVHSDTVGRELRAAGFAGPIARIPHGAWLLDKGKVAGDRLGYRTRLGLTETTPLIGIFGFLKPYKRIAESLRAFRRLIRLVPEARMILVGEAHPELPLASMLQSMQLTGHVRHLDFVPIEDFNGYLAACDIVLNLRFPTVGESSGTLLRALGMGKAVVVSDVGSFSEFPDEICLKAPVDSSEEEHLFEYLNLLVSRPEMARALGAHARAWVEQECGWESVSRQYLEFLNAVATGKEWPDSAQVMPGGSAPVVDAAAGAASGAPDSGVSVHPAVPAPLDTAVPPERDVGVPSAVSRPVDARVPVPASVSGPAEAGAPVPASGVFAPASISVPADSGAVPISVSALANAIVPVPVSVSAPISAGVFVPASVSVPADSGSVPSSVSAPAAATVPIPASDSALADEARGAAASGPGDLPHVQLSVTPSADQQVRVPGEYIASWAPVADGSRGYVETHLTRLEKTLAITPPGGPGDRVLEMGAYLQITPALKTRLGYGEVRGCYYGQAGTTNHRTVTSDTGETFCCEIDLFDAEKDRFPYPDGHFSTVLCCELIEHLPSDPMHLMSEVNRILKAGGHFVLTTPNIISMRALAGILQGFHPMLFPAYIKPDQAGESDARHAREYTPREIQTLLENSGFEVALLETGPFRAEPNPEHGWVEHLLDRYILSKDHRGDGIYALGRKTGPVRDRYPHWLYS